jgi:hypothetical protein
MFASIVVHYHFKHLGTVMPDFYDFTGDGITALGLVGVISSMIIIVTAFRRFYNSPYNVQYKAPQQTPEVQEIEE